MLATSRPVRNPSNNSIWDKVFKSGLSKFCGRQPLKNFRGYGLLKQTISSKFFKGCLPQNLLSPLLNTLSHITSKRKKEHKKADLKLSMTRVWLTIYSKIQFFFIYIQWLYSRLMHALFYKSNAFFHWASVLLNLSMNSASDVA